MKILIIIHVPEDIFRITVTVPEACVIISFSFMIATISLLIKLFCVMLRSLVTQRYLHEGAVVVV